MKHLISSRKLLKALWVLHPVVSPRLLPLLSQSLSRPRQKLPKPLRKQKSLLLPRLMLPRQKNLRQRRRLTPLLSRAALKRKIETFLNGLLAGMGSTAVAHAVKQDGNTYFAELVGEDLGYLIGRRGDTLDAIQHLCNYSVNRGVEGHIRINVDAECYREKREDSLRRYAVKKAQQVLKAHRRTTLEPMNAYERHVIHASLQDMDRITTYSVGTEPNRRVVIEYVR